MGFRITRIYVSSKESTKNGRRNWNVPKSVAEFSITTASDGMTTIMVTRPGASEPFFHVKTKPVPILHHIPLPLNTKLFGKYMTITQPPLPAREQPEEIATRQWASFFPTLKGLGRMECLYPQLDGKVGNGKDFPAVVPWSVGTYAPEVVGENGEAAFTDAMM
ncbi:hypothetical protein H0H87_009409 [Tephrocybe sp. NHM501043]|nr:hypothetical protein H0H87_009409 [Tephrocybe sp. NHM501043]